MKDKRILITGCAGSIGSELVRQLYKDNKIYGLDINETGVFDVISDYGISGRVGDIRNPAVIEDAFSDFKPQIIFHTAAYKHVPLMEKYPLEAIQTNIVGTYNLIHYAKKYRETTERFIFISSDKAVQSTSIMGATKRMGEIMCRNQGEGFTVVRFGNVLGSRGSVIPIWQKQINEGKEVTVTDTLMERYMMTIEEACNLVIEACKRGVGGEIYILDMGKPVNILDLAKKIIKESGKEIKIKITGMRSGEVLTERLMSEEEERTAVKEDKFYIIR